MSSCMPLVEFLSFCQRHTQSHGSPRWSHLYAVQLETAADDTQDSMPFEAVIIRPASATQPLPAVLFPHGGPHAAYVRTYAMPTAFLPALGYVIIAVRATATASAMKSVSPAWQWASSSSAQLRGLAAGMPSDVLSFARQTARFPTKSAPPAQFLRAV